MQQAILCVLAALLMAMTQARDAVAQTGYDCATCNNFNDLCEVGAGADDRCVESESGEWCASWGNLPGVCEPEDDEEELLAIAPMWIGGSGTLVSSPMWLARTSFNTAGSLSDEVLTTCRSFIVARSYSTERQRQIKSLTERILL